MSSEKTDVLLIGGGIMSVTLATLVAELDDSRSITLVEQADQLGLESSDVWNNAGTGHAGYCELNYTPVAGDGSVSIDRALDINERFEQSLQLWSSLVTKGRLPDASSFVRRVPHYSWVRGQQNVEMLHTRQQALTEHSLFEGMDITDSRQVLDRWLPLLATGRTSKEPMAATRVAHGSDINFGELTRSLGHHLSQQSQVQLELSHRVVDLQQTSGRWQVTLQSKASGSKRMIDAGFVFIGAGGASLSLLQKSGVQEAKGYGGFPVSGLWLACRNQELAIKHQAKVYSQAAVGAPPMSVPHLDTRYINGQPALLFGPFAGFTTKFLKAGHTLDLVRSVRSDNLRNLLYVARTQWSLTHYLIKEALASRGQRLEHLRAFYPSLNPEEWELVRAGQRVQIIKTGANGRGSLEFGTEVLATEDGSIAALLGASPGASTCVSAMLTVLEKCLPELLTGHRLQTLQALIPSYGQSLKEDASLLRNVRAFTHPTLGLVDPVSPFAIKRSDPDVDRNTQRDCNGREPSRDYSGRRAGVA